MVGMGGATGAGREAGAGCRVCGGAMEGAAGAAAEMRGAGAWATGAAALGGAWIPEGPPGGSVGSLMVGAADGLGGKLMRTVSFLGCTLPVSFFGGGTAPDGMFGGSSAIIFPRKINGGEGVSINSKRKIPGGGAARPLRRASKCIVAATRESAALNPHPVGQDRRAFSHSRMQSFPCF